MYLLSRAQKKRIAFSAGIMLAFLVGLALGGISMSSNKGLKSSYLGDSSITCTRTCSDGNTIDAELSCPDISTTCGDGNTQTPNSQNQYEQCDDGNQEDNDGCTNQCQYSTYSAGSGDTTNNDTNTNQGEGANAESTCNGRMAQCGSDSLNPCETGVSSVQSVDDTTWSCTLKNSAGELCSGSAVSCGQPETEPDESACECRETGNTTVTDENGNAVTDENGNTITRPVITCSAPVDAATGTTNTKYAKLSCGLRESTENRAALENARKQVDGSFGTNL